MKVLFFGKLKDITHRREIELSGVKSISELKSYLFKKYPTLSKEKFSVAVNGEIKNDDDFPLEEKDEVALLPPIAGG